MAGSRNGTSTGTARVGATSGAPKAGGTGGTKAGGTRSGANRGGTKASGGGGGGETTGTLRINRRFGGLPFRAFDVHLDGELIDDVGQRETVERRIPAGPHTLQLKVGHGVSPERSFTLHAGGIVTYWCRGALIWPIYLASFVKPSLGITLKPQ